MSSHISHFIGGHTEDGTGTRTGAVFNPSTGVEQARVRFADEATVALAVDIATAAGKTWGRVSHAARQQVVFRMRELVMRDVDKLARSIGREHGKTIADAKGEAMRALETLEFAVAAPQVTKGEYSRNVGGGIDAYSVREPVGVVACISPFNFPLMAPMMMGAMAVATGNAVILKPSEKVPSSALEIAALWKEAGLPDGIWNVVQGDKEAVDAILVHPGIAAVCFVGSTPVGEYVFQKGTSTNKRVAAYTGGKNHMVVMPDADLKSAADAFVSAGYGSSSQRCMAVSLLLAVGEGTAERLRELIVPRVNALHVGPYDDPKADYGALISAESRATVVKAIEACVADGGELLTDGRSLKVSGYEGGYYLGPTLLDHVTTDMAFYKHEIFGPVRGIMRAANLDEAIAITNAHDYGNGAVIYTREGRSANRFVAEVEAGMIGVNVSVPVPVGYYNFGGFRRSRFGDAQMFGPEAARFYTKLKTVSQRWPESDASAAPTSLAFSPNA
jgi:malonate-semialdehyde dehydrogenase (acetylating) / methylmalonate-semialdehyde dehydrogenase